MKIKGKTLGTPNIEVVVFPRSDGDIVFKAQAVLDYSDADQLDPEPSPPEVIKRGGARIKDPNDREYREKLEKWALRRSHWMFLKSISATPDLEWETVNASDPETWGNYSKELAAAGFTPIEISRLLQTVMDACGLNQKKIDEATERFLAGQAAK